MAARPRAMSSGVAVVQQHGVAACGGHLCDARAHLAGTDDGNLQRSVISTCGADQPTCTSSASP